MKCLFVLLFFPIIVFSQGNDPETILAQKKAKDEQMQVFQDSITKVNFPRDLKGDVCYTGVEKLDLVNTQELYSRAKLFVAETYKSNKDVTQLNDDAARIILIKPVIKSVSKGFLTGGLQTFVNYQLKIECKEDRYRYTIDGLTVSYLSSSGLTQQVAFAKKYLPTIYTKKMAVQLETDVNFQLVQLITLLKKQMATKNSDF